MNMFSCPKEPNKMMISSNTEEFSFPVVCNNPLSNFMLSSSSSSSLWRISSKVYHQPEDYYEDKQEEHDDNDNGDDYCHMEVRSMCEEILPSNRREIERSVSFQSKDLEVEERMDFLWEDFHEEEKKEGKERRNNSEKMGVLQVRNMTRRISSGNSSKMLVIWKSLKGLASLRKSAQHKLLKTRF